MRLPLRRAARPPLVAIALAGLLAATSVAATAPASPAVNTWGRIGPAVPPAFTAANLGETVVGSAIGPDGRYYVWGSFVNVAGDPTADYLVAYDPATGGWVGLGSNGAGDGALNGIVSDVAWIGSTLYAGGFFVDAGGAADADYLAAWNGSSWSARGSVGGAAAFTGVVRTLDAANGVLYAGGAFANAAGIATADRIAAYDGSGWSALGSNGAGDGAIGAVVWAVDALPDGRVYVGGDFVNAGGVAAADKVALFQGGSWGALGSVDGIFNDRITSIVVSGSKVWVSGFFDDAAGNPSADSVALWNGSAWTNLGTNAGNGVFAGQTVWGVALYGSNLIVTGQFANAKGNPAMDMVAAWNGSTWLPLGVFDPNASATLGFSLMVSGRTLYLAGRFIDAANVTGATGIAAFGLPAPPSAPRSLAGTSGSRRVTLSWAAPSTTNGAPIRDYVVQYRKRGTSTWKTFADGVRTTRSATVTGLSSGVTYEFRVRAVNDWGTGTASAILAKRAG